MTVLVPIENANRARRGLVLRRGAHLGEASPLRGRSIETVEDVVGALASSAAPPPSLDFALWALDAKTTGGKPIVSQVLLEDAATATKVARAALDRGQRAFKLKIRSRSDADVLAELRAMCPEALLRVDANRCFARETEVPWDELARARVEWIEEPCPAAGSLAGTPVAIALDESVAIAADQTLADLEDGRVSALVLKPTLLGATETLRIARACRARGGRAIVSHSFESEIGRRAAEELARQIDPAEIHGLARWDGIDAYRLVLGGAPVRTLFEADQAGHVDSTLG